MWVGLPRPGKRCNERNSSSSRNVYCMCNLGCVSFFCTHLCWTDRGGRRPSEKRFVPGIARARMSRWLLLAGLSRRTDGSSNRGVRQPIHPYSPHDEEPKGTVQTLLTLCLPPTPAQHLSLSSCCRPRLVPAPIADRIAQHQHGVDVLPTEAACQRL